MLAQYAREHWLTSSQCHPAEGTLYGLVDAEAMRDALMDARDGVVSSHGRDQED